MRECENLKHLEREMNNLIITHSPSIATDNMLSGEMEKYYFEHPAKCQIENDSLCITEQESREEICLELSDIASVSNVTKNDNFMFPQKNVCALLYKNGQIITFYFD